MVKLPVARSANVELVSRRPLIVVSAGGTSGIGKATLRELAATSGREGGKELRVYIVGRTANVAGDLISDLTKLCPDGEFIFIQCHDLALLRDVDHVCDEITAQERKRAGSNASIDLLIMSQAIVDFGGRKETSEGLDNQVSLLYYSRIRFIHKLLPLLTVRSHPQQPAHVVSVYAAGLESQGKLFPNDLSLREKGHYSFSNARTHVVHMKTMVFEQLAKEHAGKLSLVHVYPSLVLSEAFKKPTTPAVIRYSFLFLKPVLRLFAVPLPESGQRTMFLASSRFPARSESDINAADAKPSNALPVAVSTDGVLGGGAYATNYDGETVKNSHDAYSALRQQAFPDQSWQHTNNAFTTIEHGKRFTD